MTAWNFQRQVNLVEYIDHSKFEQKLIFNFFISDFEFNFFHFWIFIFKIKCFLSIHSYRRKRIKNLRRWECKCYQTAERKLFGEDIIDGLIDEKAKSFRLDCNCLAACTSIAYEAVIDRIKIDFETAFKSYKISLDSVKG